MNPQHLLIYNACRILVLDTEANRFSSEQKEELLQILDVFRDLKISNIFKFKKTVTKFEDTYCAYGGDHDKLMESIRNIRDQQYIAAIKAVHGLKITKDGKEI